MSDSGEGNVQCPSAKCSQDFVCEACLNVHLLDLHGVRYVEVFGPQDPAFVRFCNQHADLSPAVLGG